ncbi:MAG: hypothetical protein KIT31_10485 [Deltaproteobacteria bacterium]|nr:hypothetical protein [Deltaproteobacteria bacterium]
MSMRTLLVLALFAAACGEKYTMVAPPPSLNPAAEAVAHVPRFVVVPAVDARPRSERGGRGLEQGLMMVSIGGGLGKMSGAEVLDGDESLVFQQNPFTGLATSASTGVAADVGRALQAASNRPVDYRLTADAAARSPDGTVLVGVVIDHLTRMQPRNHEFSVTKHQENRPDGRYEVTTTKTKTETFSSFWVFSLRIQLAQVRNGKVTHRLVRYATLGSPSPSGYGMAIAAATDEIIRAVATTWQP